MCQEIIAPQAECGGETLAPTEADETQPLPEKSRCMHACVCVCVGMCVCVYADAGIDLNACLRVCFRKCSACFCVRACA